MESAEHVLKLSYGERNACISVTADISFSSLREKAAKKFSLSQSFTLECYDAERLGSPCWLEVGDEDMERLSEWRELRVRALDDRGHVISVSGQSVRLLWTPRLLVPRSMGSTGLSSQRNFFISSPPKIYSQKLVK